MKTLGQIAFEKFYYSTPHVTWQESSNHKHWENIAQEVLESQWRSVNYPPENQKEKVLLCGKEGVDLKIVEFEDKYGNHTHWMSIAKFPKSKDREEFEEWAKQYFTSTDEERRQDIAWKAWEAARNIK